MGLFIIGLTSACQIDFEIILTCSGKFDTSGFTPQELETIVFLEISNTTTRNIAIDSDIFINLETIVLKNNSAIQCYNIKLLSNFKNYKNQYHNSSYRSISYGNSNGA